MTNEREIRVTRRAADQIRRAADWWERNRALAPGAVHHELREAFNILRSHPGIGASATNTKARGIRRIHLSRIHYYRVRANAVEVLALWHTSRGSGPNV